MQTFNDGAPWMRLHVDLTGPHPRSRRGYTYILTVVDAFSKYALAYPLRDKSADGIAKVLADQVFTVYGTPFQLLSDLGREFDNQILSELARLMGIHRIRTTSYKPSTNGIAERFHRTLNSALAKVVRENQVDWCERTF